MAAERSAEETASRDPATYGAVSGAFQENPYESNPLSVLDPKRKQVTDAAMAFYPAGMAFNLLPGFGLFKKGKQAIEATKEGTGALEKLANAPMSRRGFLKAASSPLVASAIGKPASFLPPLENLIPQAAPVAATVARTVAPLSAASLAKVQNFLPTLNRMNRPPDMLDRANIINSVKPEGMTTPEFIRGLKQHPEQFKKFKDEIDRLQQEARFTEFDAGSIDSKQEYLNELKDRSPAAIARESRLWDQNLNPFGQGKLLYEPLNYKYLPEDIRFKVFELDMADDILEKLPKGQGGALAALPNEIKDRLFLPLVGKPIKEVKSLMSSIQLTLPAEIGQLKNSKSVTPKVLEHFSQDPEKLLAQAQDVVLNKTAKPPISDEMRAIKAAQRKFNKAEDELQTAKLGNPAGQKESYTRAGLNYDDAVEMYNRRLDRVEKARDAAKEELETLKAAPYTQEVLPAAEREANLQAMQAKSATPGDWYHGTSRDIQQFEPKQAGATFLTKEPGFADDFANNSASWMGENIHEFLTPEQLEAGKAKAVELMKKSYGTQNRPHQKNIEAEIYNSGKGGVHASGEAQDFLAEAYKDSLPSGPNIMKVHVGAENPWDYENPQHVSNLLDEVNGNPKFNELTTDQLSKGSWNRIEGPDIQEAIRSLGHDSFYMNENGTRNLGVYDPAKIKSAYGNVGTYDLTNPDINKKDGGSVSRYRRPVKLSRYSKQHRAASQR